MTSHVAHHGEPMTKAERTELMKLVQLNAKVAKQDAEARGRAMLADAEARLAAIFSSEDALWADLTEEAEAKIVRLDAELARRARERGIPESFRPRIHSYFSGRGENGDPRRRAELRRVAQEAVAARVKQAQVEIDRHAAHQLTELAAYGLTSEAARAFLSDMPRPDDLLPPLGRLELGDGEVVLLETALPEVTDETALAVTDSRNTCAHCGKPFQSSRSDGRYCSSTCRVAAHRKRLAGGGR